MVPVGRRRVDTRARPNRKQSNRCRLSGRNRSNARVGLFRTKPAKHEAVRPEPATNEPVKRETAKPELPQTTRPEKPQQRLTASDERGSFQQAKLAYLKGDYQAALELFSDFRSKYPSSVFSADVALYQADCLLHLSGE